MNSNQQQGKCCALCGSWVRPGNCFIPDCRYCHTIPTEQKCDGWNCTKDHDFLHEHAAPKEHRPNCHHKDTPDSHNTTNEAYCRCICTCFAPKESAELPFDGTKSWLDHLEQDVPNEDEEI